MDNDLCFHLDMYIQKKHHIILNEYIRYANSDITKLFKMGILQYYKCMHKVFELANNLYHNSRNNDKYHDNNWDTRGKALS